MFRNTEGDVRVQSANPLFILAGNGSYYNRGCEAILRGTVRILRQYFGDPRFLAVSYFPDEAHYCQQCHEETDADIVHKKMHHECRRFDALWFVYRGLRLVFPGGVKHLMYKDIKARLDEAQAVLALGGDNYSVDMGYLPTKCTDLDDLVLARHKPMVIWGASVGPFDSNPPYEKYMQNHLRPLHIMAREPLTYQYLCNLGLAENTYRVADPAFLMPAVDPAEAGRALEIDPGSIGMNFSPLMSRFVTRDDMPRWIELAAEIVRAVQGKIHRRVYLVPHVFGSEGNNDHSFMERVRSRLASLGDRIILVPPHLSAAQLKWVIARMSLFAGARMHATIAAWSSGVPTMSFSYSVKSRGLNEDMYGHTGYCLDTESLRPNIVSDRLMELNREADHVRSRLLERLPAIEDMALKAGDILRKILQP
jgi:polysaccharide pyruvyl transferase WcaK-like protein